MRLPVGTSLKSTAAFKVGAMSSSGDVDECVWSAIYKEPPGYCRNRIHDRENIDDDDAWA